jgi:hypothetical protein
MPSSALVVATLLIAGCGESMSDVRDPCPSIHVVESTSRRGGRRAPVRVYYLDDTRVSDATVERFLLDEPRAHDEAARARAWRAATFAAIGLGAITLAGSIAIMSVGSDRSADGRDAAGGALFFTAVGATPLAVALSVHERTAHLERAVADACR